MFNRGTTTPRGRALGAATVAVLAAAGTLVAVPTAQAVAPTASHLTRGETSTTFSIPPGVTTYQATAGGAHVTVTRSPEVSPAVTINCQVTASSPFRFYGGPVHYPSGSGVEGLAHTTCDQVVNTIDLLVVLFRSTTAVASNETFTYSTLQGAADTEYAYTPGWTWQTGAQAAVTFPDGTTGVSTPAYSAATYIP
ncbi:hypothetical protein ACWERV_22090 [Streptomyces sp. NPDC004031]